VRRPRDGPARGPCLAGRRLLAALSLLIAAAALADTTLVVEVVWGNRVLGVLEALDTPTGLSLPLLDLCELLQVSVLEREQDLVLSTPLGTAPVPKNRLSFRDGAPFIDEGVVREVLAIELTLDRATLTLRLDLPWRPAKAGEAAAAPELVPEVGPPANAISSVRGSLSYVTQSGDSQVNGSLLMRGRALDGAWRLWWEDSTAGPSLVREAAWYRGWGRKMVLAGKQAVQTSPLLDSFDLAGAQYGWSSVRRGAATGYFEGQQLITRQATPIRTFRGSAPAASVVVLKLDGTRVAAQQVGFSGEYEFVDVELPSRGLIVVEVEIYQRQNLTVPIEVRRQLSTASALLLADGATTVATGGGLAGRFTSGFIGSSSGEPSHPGGYFYARHGLTDWATAEASVEALGSHVEGSAGLVAQLSRPFLLQAALVGGGGEVGWDASLSGSFERGILSVRSQSQPAGLTYYGLSADRWDHIAEGFYRVSSGLDLGLIARRINDGVEEADFVRPTVRWRPFSRLSLSAFPDTYGDYQANLFAQPGRNVWLAVNYAKTTNAELTVGVAQNLQVGVTAEAGGGLDERYTAYLGGSWARFPGLTFKAGAITSAGRSGGLLSVNAPIGFGLLGALDYQAVPSRVSGPAFSQPRLSISVIADLAVAGRGLVPASASGMVRGSGAVAGRLRAAEGLSLPGVSLADVAVLVDGRSRGMTGAQGAYFIGYLPEGVHTVEIDVGNLPIALVPVKSVRVARVVSGGVTRVDFELRLEFGLAGRVRDAIGTPLAGVRVELVAPGGEIVARGRTDSFGLYRIDGVATGRYVVRLSKDSVPEGVVPPSREIAIVDDFLFDQDVTLPVAVPPMPADGDQPD